MATAGVFVTRRTWTWGEKRQIVDEAFSGEASVSSVARRHGLQAHQIYRWRDGLAAAVVTDVAADFVAVEVRQQVDMALLPALSDFGADVGVKSTVGASGAAGFDCVEIGLPGGMTVRVPASVGTAFVAELVKGLSRGLS